MKKIISILLIISLMSICMVHPVSAPPYLEVWVDDDGPVDSTHFTNIQDGIDAVCDGGTVHVAAGTYLLSNQLIINKGLSLLGEGDEVTIVDGDATYRGLWINNATSHVLVDGFTFMNCSGLGGGGVFIFTSVATITNCTIKQNAGSQFGGGIYNAYSNLILTNCRVLDNSAVTDESVVLTSGGGLCNNNSIATISDCILTDNSATYCGGGVYNQYSRFTITNSIFSCNFAEFGAGMHNYYPYSTSDSPYLITNCTFTGNSAETRGGGMCNEQCPTTVTNCIFWGDDAQEHDEIYSDFTQPTVTYSDVQLTVGDVWPDVVNADNTNINADPLFKMSPSDVSLQAGSPCIDTGTDSSDPSYGSVIDDILGVMRPQGTGYDMGAYEYVVGESENTWSPVSIMPLMSTQLANIGNAWSDVAKQLPGEPSDEMTVLIERIQEHMEHATGMSNPIYASSELARAQLLINELSALMA